MALSSKRKQLYKDFLHLALPVMVLSILNSTLGMADVMMVGSLGEAAVAGVGLAAKLHFITILVILGFAIAGRVLVSQYFGAKHTGKIKESLVLTLFTSTVMITPFAFLFGFSPENWLQYISTDPAIQKVAGQYLEITAILVIFSAINLTFEISLRAIGYTTFPLILGAMAAILNILFNYAFIFGKFGAPEMGVMGAAWGSFVARSLQFAILIITLYATNNLLALKFREFKILTDIKKWRSFFMYALPVVTTFLIFGIGSSLYYVISGHMGGEALTVISIISPIEALVISLFVGYGEAASILVGRALGAKKYRFAWLLRKIAIRYGIMFAIGAGFLLWALHPIILSPFTTLDSATLALVTSSYLVLCSLIWVKVQNMIIVVGVLRAGGDNTWCLKLEIVSLWFIGLPATALVALVYGWSFDLVYLMMFLEGAVKLIASEWRIHQKVWLKNLTYILND
ncbi:MAG: putative MATE family efflux protein [Lentisphaeria bacterium]|jgi:putative MATE family efflux protein